MITLLTVSTKTVNRKIRKGRQHYIGQVDKLLKIIT